MFFTNNKKRTPTPRQKEGLWIKARKSCEACGIKIDRPSGGHSGHKKAYSLGGKTEANNMVFLCMPCNNTQNKKGWVEFIIQSYKIEPKKFRKAYVVEFMKERKNKIEEISKKISKVKIYISKTKSEKNKSRALAYIDRMEKNIKLLESDLKQLKKGKIPSKRKNN